MTARGTVYLVGAGPGDPGLITARGLALVREAEVLVYDRLVSPRLVAEAPTQAEVIYAGKGPHGHALEQEEINALLVERGRAGKRVVRLKGGDPFVFGRGGEEAEALAAAGLPFQVVPGVTSAVAVPAYAGIPVTDRRYSASLRVITGREGEAEKGAAGRHETVVVLMGVEGLAEVVERLAAQGWATTTPVALIERGTTARQRTLTTTLAGAVESARTAGLRPPAIAVVGDVVRLRDRIAWEERRPLAGLRVVVTRTRAQAADLCAEMEGRGAETLVLPALEIAQPQDWGPLDAALQEIGRFRWLAFTSTNGVDFTLGRLWALGRDVRSLASVHVAAVGPGTAAALARHGVRADLVPARFTTRALLDSLRERVRPGDRVLLPRADIAGDELPHGLEELGAQVCQVVAYRSLAPPGLAQAAREALADGADLVVFTSASTVVNTVDALGADRALLERAAIACIGPVTAEAARAAGLAVAVEAEDHTVQSIAQAIVAWRRAGGGLGQPQASTSVAHGEGRGGAQP